MSFLVNILLPVLVQTLVSQLKGGAATTWASFEAGQPVKAAGVTVPGFGHVTLSVQLAP